MNYFFVKMERQGNTAEEIYEQAANRFRPKMESAFEYNFLWQEPKRVTAKRRGEVDEVASVVVGGILLLVGLTSGPVTSATFTGIRPIGE